MVNRQRRKETQRKELRRKGASRALIENDICSLQIIHDVIVPKKKAPSTACRTCRSVPTLALSLLLCPCSLGSRRKVEYGGGTNEEPGREETPTNPFYQVIQVNVRTTMFGSYDFPTKYRGGVPKEEIRAQSFSLFLSLTKTATTWLFGCWASQSTAGFVAHC
jgi:hypothetical protein